MGENQAEEALIWWKEQFGDDFYMEVMRHNQEDEDIVNKALVALARKHDVKLLRPIILITSIKKMPMHTIFYCV